MAFTTPEVSLEPGRADVIRTLSELVEFHTRYNANHVFCVQAERDRLEDRNSCTEVSYTKLKQAILRCQIWLSNNVQAAKPPVRGSDGIVTKSPPVALLMESDLGLAVYFLTLLGLGVPIVLLSARLSPIAVRHLLQRTGASTTIVSPSLRGILSEALSSHPADATGDGDRASSKPPRPAVDGFTNGTLDLEVRAAVAYKTFIDDRDPVSGAVHHHDHFISEEDRQVVILHSSGTSGLPKPIYCSHKHFLGFSLCHDFSSSAEAQGLTISTSPFFHGFGLVPLCLSLGIGKPFCIPAPSAIPTGSLIADLIEDSGAKSLLTVPSVLEEIALLPQDRGITALRSLDFVAFGGGLPKASIGEKLDAAGVRLINHYGATETGPLAPFFVPPPGHDWRYVRLRQDILSPLAVRLERTEAADQPGEAHKLSMRPFGWSERFELQDLLLAKPGSPTEFSIAGRTDDLICLATGEKVRPTILEASVSQHDGVRAATAFGDQRFELGVIVESTETLDAAGIDALKEALWPVVQEAGRQMDAHARITSPVAILVVPPNSLPRSDKGTVLRREVNRKFADEIADVYRSLEAAGSVLAFDVSAPESSIRAMVSANVEWRVRRSGDWSDDDDFFELGMDSLQATKLRRVLVSSVRAARENGNDELDVERVTDDVVYRNPSVNKLAKALTEQIHAVKDLSLAAVLGGLVDKYSGRGGGLRQGATVVITGATGSLGSFVLARLLGDVSVARVISLVRPSQDDAYKRQKHALESRGITLSDEEWSKVEVHQTSLTGPYLGLEKAQYDRIASEMTHILHLTWPMSFKLLLPSFNASFATLQSLVQLSSKAHTLNPWKKPRLLFISSISTVGNYPSVSGELFVPERPTETQECTLELGYAKAKFVCEKIIERAAVDHPEVQAGYVRVGQVSGARSGFWNADEHFSALVGSSKTVGKFPDLRGTLSWLPVDSAAAAIVEIIFDQQPLRLVYHLENPVRQSWQEMVGSIAREVGVSTKSIVPFEEWLDAVVSFPEEGNPARKLAGFFRKEFCKMSCGGVILDTSVSRSVSSTMRKMRPVGDDQVKAYLQYWRSIGLLK